MICLSTYLKHFRWQVGDTVHASPSPSAIIRSERGDYFAVHAGVSDLVKTIDDINVIDRFNEPDTTRAMLYVMVVSYSCVISQRSTVG